MSGPTILACGVATTIGLTVTVTYAAFRARIEKNPSGFVVGELRRINR